MKSIVAVLLTQMLDGERSGSEQEQKAVKVIAKEKRWHCGWLPEAISLKTTLMMRLLRRSQPTKPLAPRNDV